MGGFQGVAVVAAEHPAAAGQRVLIHLASDLMLTENPKVGGQAKGRVQRVGVVLAEQATPADHMAWLDSSWAAPDWPERRR